MTSEDIKIGKYYYCEEETFSGKGIVRVMGSAEPSIFACEVNFEKNSGVEPCDHSDHYRMFNREFVREATDMEIKMFLLGNIK